MPSIATGVDIVEVARIRTAAERWQGDFLDRVFTPAERRYAGEGELALQRLAARFAAKEAVLKALGTGLSGGLSWREIEVWNEASGRPRVRLRGAAARRKRELGVREIEISLSHTAAYAMAQVVLVRGTPRSAPARKPRAARSAAPKKRPARAGAGAGQKAKDRPPPK